MPSGDAFTFSLEAFYAYKLFNLNLHGCTIFVAAAEHYANARVRLIGEEEKLTIGVVAKETLLTFCSLHGEAFDICVVVIIGIAHHGTPHFAFVPLLNELQIVFVMVVGIEVREVELAVIKHHEYRVALVKLAQQLAMVIVIDALYVGIEPHLAASQRAVSCFEQTYFLDRSLTDDVSTRGSRLDNHLREVVIHEAFPTTCGCFGL